MFTVNVRFSLTKYRVYEDEGGNIGYSWTETSGMWPVLHWKREDVKAKSCQIPSCPDNRSKEATISRSVAAALRQVLSVGRIRKLLSRKIDDELVLCVTLGRRRHQRLSGVLMLSKRRL